ncbi:MAG: L-rhamnose isomerase [bacterium]|nr:L-rhamnose isomerase [bacterium]
MKNVPLPTDAINEAYLAAKRAYADLGVDTDKAITTAARIPLSLHCWQGDDVHGLETRSGSESTGGIMATGNYPGVARTGDQLRADMLQAAQLIPGTKRANIHAFYAETGRRSVDRDKLKPKHFARWMAWSKKHGIPLDFNPTFFAHPLAASGFTLSHPDEKVRQFWIRHGAASRVIAQAFADNQNSPSICNFWIPDGAKDFPADRWSPRARLIDSYDQIFARSNHVNSQRCIDSVEAKLFGIGSEEYVVGSHEFYLGYTLTRPCIPCLDMGHFHPTEAIYDKLSAILQFKSHLLIHVSRPIRWDSDHIVLFNDDLRAVFLELQRGRALDRVFLALDFFDASVNRIAAWVIGARATQQALLYALLDPTEHLQSLERRGDGAGKLALMEHMKSMPFHAVWNKYCLDQNVPVGLTWLDVVRDYEARVLRKRA